jgi:hypothetical protein
MSPRGRPDIQGMESQSNPFTDRFPFTKKAQTAPLASAPAAPPPAAPAKTDKLDVAVKAVPKLSGKERRRAARQTLVARAILRCDSAAAEAAAGFVSNISMLGVGFHTRKALPIGTMYQIKVEAGPMQWRSRVRVVSCVQHDGTGTWDVGAEFVGNELNADRARRAAMAA